MSNIAQASANLEVFARQQQLEIDWRNAELDMALKSIAVYEASVELERSKVKANWDRSMLAELNSQINEQWKRIRSFKREIFWIRRRVNRNQRLIRDARFILHGKYLGRKRARKACSALAALLREHGAKGQDIQIALDGNSDSKVPTGKEYERLITALEAVILNVGQKNLILESTVAAIRKEMHEMELITPQLQG